MIALETVVETGGGREEARTEGDRGGGDKVHNALRAHLEGNETGGRGGGGKEGTVGSETAARGVSVRAGACEKGRGEGGERSETGSKVRGQVGARGRERRWQGNGPGRRGEGRRGSRQAGSDAGGAVAGLDEVGVEDDGSVVCVAGAALQRRIKGPRVLLQSRQVPARLRHSSRPAPLEPSPAYPPPGH